MANPNPALFKRKGLQAGADAATAAKAAAAAPAGPTSSEMAGTPAAPAGPGWQWMSETPAEPAEAPSPAVAAEPEVELGEAVPGLPPAGVYGAQGDTWRYMLSTDGSIKVQDSTKGGPWIDVQEGTDAYTSIVNQLRGDGATLKLGEGAATPGPQVPPGSDESMRRAVDAAQAEFRKAADPYQFSLGPPPGPNEQDEVSRQRLFEDIRTALFGRG